MAFDSLNQLCDLLESIDCDKWEFFEQTIQQLINWKVNTLEHLLLELRSQLFSFSSDQLEAASGNLKKVVEWTIDLLETAIVCEAKMQIEVLQDFFQDYANNDEDIVFGEL